jgi:hypothetical protein
MMSDRSSNMSLFFERLTQRESRESVLATGRQINPRTDTTLHIASILNQFFGSWLVLMRRLRLETTDVSNCILREV